MNIALIPARSGSVRVKNKNIRLLNGKPLIAHTIDIALKSGFYKEVVVITDSIDYANISKNYGAIVPELRPNNTSTGEAPDILWVQWIHQELLKMKIKASTYSILRPTSPFRTIDTFRRAFETWNKNTEIDTLRAIQNVNEHPGKMWVSKAGYIIPLLPFSSDLDFWHNSQSNTLPEIFVQNASFEIFKTSNLTKYHSITGKNIVGFKTLSTEGFDINTERDFLEAERLVKIKGKV